MEWVNKTLRPYLFLKNCHACNWSVDTRPKLKKKQDIQMTTLISIEVMRAGWQFSCNYLKILAMSLYLYSNSDIGAIVSKIFKQLIF